MDCAIAGRANADLPGSLSRRTRFRLIVGELGDWHRAHQVMAGPSCSLNYRSQRQPPDRSISLRVFIALLAGQLKLVLALWLRSTIGCNNLSSQRKHGASS